MSAKKIDDAMLAEMVNAGMTIGAIARRFGCHKRKVSQTRKRLGMSAEHGSTMAVQIQEVRSNKNPKHPIINGPIRSAEYIMPTPAMPEALLEKTARVVTPLQVSDVGHWLVLSDTHIPFHDKATCELAIAEAKRMKANVLLNGDLMDSGALSRHKKHSSPVEYRKEIAMGREFLEYLRYRLPKARILYKFGNHEERFDAYLVERAPVFEDLEGFNISSLLHTSDYGVEVVRDCRMIRLGKLYVLHGHEYRGGGGGVNPARWLFLKTHDVAMCGHFHRTTTHSEKSVGDYHEYTWSNGCACNLYPEWLPKNNWDHGYAMVELKSGDDFYVTPRRVISGVAR